MKAHQNLESNTHHIVLRQSCEINPNIEAMYESVLKGMFKCALSYCQGRDIQLVVVASLR